jgi:CheY-like chemotaxis protein
VQLTVRTKLIAIVATAGLAFMILLAASAFIEQQINRELSGIRDRYLPRIELGPKLRHGFEQLTRRIQDATAAQDLDALAATRRTKDELLGTLDAAKGTMTAADVAALRTAFEDYYAIASEVSRRLIQDETGEDLVEAMAGMQTQQLRAEQLVVKATLIEEGELSGAFAAAGQAQLFAVKMRVGVTLVCMVMVIALALALGRSVLRSIGELETGLKRFGRGELAEPIHVTTRDELGLLAEQANLMAAGLRQLNEERDRADWLREGQAGLSRELRGGLEPREVASNAVRFLVGYLEAPVGVFYGLDDDDALAARAHCGADTSELGALRFAPGQGLVGRAALDAELVVVTDLPDSYLRVRSGLGEGRPHAIVLLPLAHLGRVTGLIELAVLKPWTETQSELLRAVQETITIALDVAEARSALRTLLAETQRQAERLTAQEEELRATNDELRSQQEELQAQQEELREANETLVAQQRVLEEKNSELADARIRLEQKNDELASVSAYKSQFLANMSHELRTPLNSMLLLSNLLAQNEAANLSERQVDFCKTIYGAGKDLLALINQVLDLAKIESGKQDAIFEQVRLRDLTERVERIFLPLARDKGLELNIELATGVPDEIVTDRQRIDQILNNLLGNAIKFTDRGSVSLRIGPADPHARFTRSDLDPRSTIALVVRDTGIGIAAEHQESVFAPFEQVDGSPDRRYGGTGLGLAIGRELAALLGGELQLHSTPHEGSTFTCYLPHEPPSVANLVRPSFRPAPNRNSRPPAADDRDALSSGDPHLLVIEDDPVFADIVGDVIRGQGLKYIVAGSGQAALELARERKPSGVILDVRLPDVDGFEVMKSLRADPLTAEVPVHFVSALDSGELGMALGAVGYLTKPASRNDILRAVQSIAPKPSNKPYSVLLVEDDASISELLAGRLGEDEVQVERACSAKEALELLQHREFSCMVLDLALPDMNGLDLLRMLHEQGGKHAPPVVVYTGRPLSKAEAKSLEAYTEAIVLKDGPSTDRVLDEIRLFLRRLKAGLPATRRPSTLAPTLRLEGKTLLLADDDMRTVYALSAILRAKGADVLMADTGKVALDVLDEHPDIDAVLMDIMMPEMDGYEAIRRIRLDPRFEALPIIALTAKAMKGDREKCIEIGATDYLPKPIDPDALSAMLQSRLKEAPHRGA